MPEPPAARVEGCYGRAVGRRWVRPGTVTALLVGVAIVAASVALPMIMLLHSDEETLSRWSQIGQALAAVGVFFSGVAFIGIATALLMQQRELANQHEELRIVQEEQRRSSEISLRQLHMDIIKMAINDRDLLSVWPPTGQGATRGKKDQYCNLILNLQKMAYETGTSRSPSCAAHCGISWVVETSIRSGAERGRPGSP